MKPLAVWKYRLTDYGFSIVEMPLGARVLAAQSQFSPGSYHPICVWVLVDPAASKVRRQFLTAPTGESTLHLARVGVNYVGTVQLEGGATVVHVFDLGELHNIEAS